MSKDKSNLDEKIQLEQFKKLLYKNAAINTARQLASMGNLAGQMSYLVWDAGESNQLLARTVKKNIRGIRSGRTLSKTIPRQQMGVR